MPRSSKLWWLVSYVVVLAAVTGGLWHARRRALRVLAQPPAQVSWQAWQSAAERQADGSGPVARRPPQTAEPPELVLLRDHFATSLGGLLLLTSAVFATAMFMFRGVMAGPQFQVRGDREPSVADSPPDRD